MYAKLAVLRIVKTSAGRDEVEAGGARCSWAGGKSDAIIREPEEDAVLAGM